MDSKIDCRILVVASQAPVALDLADQITEATPANSDWQPVPDDPDTDIVPWIISNKYYTAPVHFKAVTLQAFGEGGFTAPAVIFVFESPTKDSVTQQMAFTHTRLKDIDPEVAIAVLKDAPESVDTSPANREELQDALTTYGLEIVDLRNIDGEESDDVHTLGHVIETLSTIMWPSLQRHDIPASKLDRHQSLNLLVPAEFPESAPSPGLDPWNSQEDSLFSLNDSTVSETDLKLLEAWLESDDISAWDRKDTVPIPTPSIIVTNKSGANQFDDDFGPFAVPSEDVGSSYGKVSATPSSLPSHDEVSATASRIFGPQIPVHDPEAGAEAISHAFIQLQALRDEISTMSDVDQRRAAAARVALAFASKFNISPNEDDET